MLSPLQRLGQPRGPTNSTTQQKSKPGLPNRHSPASARSAPAFPEVDAKAEPCHPSVPSNLPLADSPSTILSSFQEGAKTGSPGRAASQNLHGLGQATVLTSRLLFPLKKNIKPTFHIHPLNNSLGSSYRVAKCPPRPRQRPRVHYRTLYEVSSRRDSTSQPTFPKGT